LAIRAGLLAAAAALSLSLAGCLSLGREAPRPGRTTVGAKSVGVPAETYGNFLIVETKWDKYGPYHFLIDTGSSSTLLTPELVKRYGETGFPVAEPEVRVKSAAGAATVHVEGLRTCDWVLIDCGDIIVHLFRPEIRSFYNLEKMWGIDMPGDLPGDRPTTSRVRA